jgi:uncharacterized membrane protein (UPF0136 family)
MLMTAATGVACFLRNVVNGAIMDTGPIVLLVYGVLMLVGGYMGSRAGSKVSLIAGGGSAVLLIGAWLLTFAYRDGGLWVGTVVTLLLCVTLGRRLAVTRKFMPSGMLLGVSVLVLALLLRAVLAS